MRAKEFVIEAKDSNDPTGQIAVHDQGMAIPVASQYTGDGQFKVTIKNKPYIVTVAGFEIDDNSPGNLDSFYLTDVATGKTEHVTSGWNYPEAVAIFNNLLTNQLPALKQIYKQDMELGRRTDWQEQPERLQGLKPSGYNAIPGDRFIKAHQDMKRVTGQDVDEAVRQRLDRTCWKNKHIGKPATKIKGGVRVNNCVPNESVELDEEFDLIESIIDTLAERNQVDAETIWEDLESLTDDELYVFATTTPVMEDWQKVNKKDKTDGMSKKAVSAYRREHPGSKLKTAVTTKPSKLKKGSKASKRRKSYCSRSKGQMKMHSISCAKTPDKAICKARRRWNCE